MKECTKCGTPKPLEMFGRDKQKKDGLKSACKKCYSAYDKARYWSDPEHHKERRKKHYYAQSPEQRADRDKKQKLRLNYGLEYEEYIDMLLRQEHRCYICGVHQDVSGYKGLVVDHNHSTGQIRKLLCSCCNTALGLVKEDLSILNSMIQYLEYHKES